MNSGGLSFVNKGRIFILFPWQSTREYIALNMRGSGRLCPSKTEIFEIEQGLAGQDSEPSLQLCTLVFASHCIRRQINWARRDHTKDAYQNRICGRRTFFCYAFLCSKRFAWTLNMSLKCYGIVCLGLVGLQSFAKRFEIHTRTIAIQTSIVFCRHLRLECIFIK